MSTNKIDSVRLLGGSCEDLRLPVDGSVVPNALFLNDNKIKLVDSQGAPYIVTDLVAALFDFSSHTFTTVGTTGRFGPTEVAARAAYSSAEWSAEPEFFGVTNGFQRFVVPRDGVYALELVGAGSPTFADTASRRNRRVFLNARLKAGYVLYIAVGQLSDSYKQLPAYLGTDSHQACGGSGGTFVVCPQISKTSPIVAAGGVGGRIRTVADTMLPNFQMHSAYHSDINGASLVGTGDGYSGPDSSTLKDGHTRNAYSGGGGGLIARTGSTHAGGSLTLDFDGVPEANSLVGGNYSAGRNLMCIGGFGGGGAAATDGTNSCGGGGGWSGGWASTGPRDNGNGVTAGSGMSNYLTGDHVVSISSDTLYEPKIGPGYCIVTFVGP